MKGSGLVLLGGGGHAKVVLEIARAAGEPVAGYCDPAGGADSPLLGLEWLGDDDVLRHLLARGVRRFVAALGDNRRRERISARAEQEGLSPVALVHPRAVLSPSARVEAGAVIMAGAVVNASASIGAGAIINTGATVDHDNDIGPFVHVAPGSVLAGYVTVERGALVGVGSAVGRGRPLRIGAWARLGTGSVVFTDVPAGVTVAGNPARPLSGVGAGE